MTIAEQLIKEGRQEGRGSFRTPTEATGSVPVHGAQPDPSTLAGAKNR